MLSFPLRPGDRIHLAVAVEPASTLQEYRDKASRAVAEARAFYAEQGVKVVYATTGSRLAASVVVAVFRDEPATLLPEEGGVGGEGVPADTVKSTP